VGFVVVVTVEFGLVVVAAAAAAVETGRIVVAFGFVAETFDSDSVAEETVDSYSAAKIGSSASVAQTVHVARVVDIAEPRFVIGIAEFEESFVRIAVVGVVGVGYCPDWHWGLIQIGHAIARV